MPRKKNSTAPAGNGNVAFLDDDEQLVEEVTTTKRIGRQKRKTDDDAANETTPITVNGEIVDDEPDDDEPQFSDTSLAAIIYGEGSDQVENQFCNVNIRRNPDSMNDKFLTPCTAVTNLPRITSVPLSTDTADIEDRVRREYGGGHYFFQIFFDGRLGRSWRSTLADPPDAVRRAEAEKNNYANPQPVAAAPAAAVDPMTAFLDNLEKQKRMKDLLFGDREKEFEAQISELKSEIAAAKSNPSEPKSERLELFEQAMSATGEVQSRILDHLFPSDDGKQRSWIAEIAELAIDNADKLPMLAQTVGSLIGGFFGLGSPTPPQTQPNIADVLRRPAPANAEPLARSTFRRREIEPVAENADVIHTPPTPERITELSEFADDIADVSAGDEAAQDAEIIEESKTNDKPQGRRKSADADNNA